MGTMVDEDQWTRLVRQAENENGVQMLWETNQGGKLLAESKKLFHARKLQVENV
jgi:hypothetical protein